MSSTQGPWWWCSCSWTTSTWRDAVCCLPNWSGSNIRKLNNSTGLRIYVESQFPTIAVNDAIEDYSLTWRLISRRSIPPTSTHLNQKKSLKSCQNKYKGSYHVTIVLKITTPTAEAVVWEWVHWYYNDMTLSPLSRLSVPFPLGADTFSTCLVPIINTSCHIIVVVSREWVGVQSRDWVQ